LAQLARERDAITARALSSAAELSKARRRGARKLDRAITETLQVLGMEGAIFETRLEDMPLYSSGTDRVQFILAANPGEPPRPLKQVASGGEISRVMLAVKAVLADADHIPTLVFDEVDAGVGGAVANGVASKLSGLGKTHQVISITHLPQIAAAANTHYCVSKSSQGKRTQTAITRVEGQDRVAELARLLDGSVSDVSLEHARALLAG
jgi:DNA repair protein RecN (Recombination protein N)